MQKVDKKKRKKKEKVSEKSNTLYSKNKSHISNMAFLCLHMKQDKGACGQMGSACEPLWAMRSELL